MRKRAKVKGKGCVTREAGGLCVDMEGSHGDSEDKFAACVCAFACGYMCMSVPVYMHVCTCVVFVLTHMGVRWGHRCSAEHRNVV